MSQHCDVRFLRGSIKSTVTNVTQANLCIYYNNSCEIQALKMEHQYFADFPGLYSSLIALFGQKSSPQGKYGGANIASY